MKIGDEIMTFAIGSGTKDIQQIKNTSTDMGELPIQEGDSFEAKVTGVSEDALTLDFVKNGSHETINIATSNTSMLSVNDQVKVEVLAYSKDELKLSITKLTDESSKNNSISSDAVDVQTALNRKSTSYGAQKLNLDDLKKIIIDTNNPLQYSKQLDQHIEEAITQVETMLQSFSDEDLQVMINENYDLSKMTVDLLYQVGHSPRIDKRIELIGDKDLEMAITVNEKAINELIKEGVTNTYITQVPEEKLKETIALLAENEIQPSLNTIEKIVRFTEKVDKIQDIGSIELIQFLSSDKESTVSELYKSIYISNGKEKKDVLSENEYRKIEADVKSIIDHYFGKQNISEEQDSSEAQQISEEQKNYDDDLMKIAKSIVMKGLALDERALSTIEFTKSDISYKDKALMAITQLQKGKKPESFEISDKKQTALMTKEDIKNSLNVIHATTDQMIEDLIDEGKPITINNLSQYINGNGQALVESDRITTEELKVINIQEPIFGNTSSSNSANTLETNATITMDSNAYNRIESTASVVTETVSREIENLEILRYQMTFKAAMRLNIEGVDLANTQLQELRNRIEGFAIQGISSPPQSISSESKSVTETPSNLASVNDNPALTVLRMNRFFSLINAGSTESIAQVALEEDPLMSISSIASKVTRGIDRYDQLRTMPRPDLGDNIEKAFSNVDAILEDLSLEKTPYNQRAVEILGRNEMAITTESIEAIKILDIQVQELMNRLTPAHVQALIKDNINVLTEPVDQLMSAISLLDKEFTISTSDTIEKSLYQMFKKEDLSEQMRNSLVGVYRMLNTIENSKGAAIGFLMEHELPVTLESLYDASNYIRSTKNNGRKIESNIDDSFGILESIEKAVPSIKDQIRTGYFEKQQSLELVMKQILSGNHDELPEVENADLQATLKQIKNEIDQWDIENSKQILQGFSEKEKALIKEGTVLEQSTAQPLKIKDWEALQALDRDQFAFKTIANDLYQRIASEDSLRERFETALTKLKDNPTTEEKIEFEKSINRLMEDSKRFVTEQNLEHQERSRLQQTTDREITKPFVQLKKEVESQLAIQRHLMKQDYLQIPLMVNGQIQQMNMYFLGKDTSTIETEDSMSIYFSFSTQNIGTANIRVQLNNDDVDVTMYSTIQEGNQWVKAFEGQFLEVFSSLGFNVNRLKYDSFNMPKAIGQDTAISQSKQVKKYQESRFESTI